MLTCEGFCFKILATLREMVKFWLNKVINPIFIANGRRRVIRNVTSCTQYPVRFVFMAALTLSFSLIRFGRVTTNCREIHVNPPTTGSFYRCSEPRFTKIYNYHLLHVNFPMPVTLLASSNPDIRNVTGCALSRLADHSCFLPDWLAWRI